MKKLKIMEEKVFSFLLGGNLIGGNVKWVLLDSKISVVKM